MSTELLIRIFISLLISGLLFWNTMTRRDGEADPDSLTTQKYVPDLPTTALPMVLGMLLLLAIPYLGFFEAAEQMLSLCFGIFLQITIYYAILLLMLPVLRNHISARACASLWLLPNLLYLFHFNHLEPVRPLILWEVSGRTVRLLVSIWAVGFASVLLWRMGSHLLFRRRILRDAFPVTEQAVLDLWTREQLDCGIKKPIFKLVRSPAVQTPLSIGLFGFLTTRVVLPCHSYSSEELQLIFRHELVHIRRSDCWSKFFFTFCTALCWFNPLMWIAMRKSADDLELTCDELVLQHADRQTRKQYAELLLKTAGQQQGFTTCLSGSARALRYRLKNTVKPRVLHSGALVVCVICFLLSMTTGYVALAYGDETGADLLLPEEDVISLRNITVYEDPYHGEFRCCDETSLLSYLRSLPLRSLTGSYTFSDSQHEAILLFDTPQGTLGLTLMDELIKVTRLYGEPLSAEFYYVPGGLDWDYLNTLILRLPSLLVHYRLGNSHYEETLTASIYSLTRDDQVMTAPPDPRETPSGVYGAVPEEIRLDFSSVPLHGYTITVEHGQGTTVFSSEDLAVPDVLPISWPAARYTVSASFAGPEQSTYEAVFRFIFETYP